MTKGQVNRKTDSTESILDKHNKLNLFILCIAVFMASLDVFIVNVALNNIGDSFGQGSLSNLSWILNGYAILYAALLVPAGKWADRFGQKNGFVWGISLFTLSSLGAALSGVLWVLILFRCLQAIGAALLTPSSLGLVLTIMPEKQKKRAVRIWTSSGSLAAAAGPVVGGVLLEISWQWIFIINVPIGIFAVLTAIQYIPDQRSKTISGMPDLWGGLLFIVSIGALALGLGKATDWGWEHPTIWGSFILFVIALIGFITQSRKHPYPIVEFSLFRSRVFTWSNITITLVNIAFAMELLSIIMYIQNIWGWSSLATALAISAGPCMVWPSAIVGQRFSKRIPFNVVAAIGMVLIGAGSLLFALSVQGSPNYWTQVLPGWLIIGIGYGMTLPIIISSATKELASDQTATGSAIVNMFRQLGSVLGTTILVVALGSSVRDLSAFENSWWIAAGLSLLGAFTALGLLPKNNRVRQQ